MTNEEAIKTFLPIVDNEAFADYFQDACRLAVQALEKQIPKLAKYEGFNNVPHPTCAVCGCVLWKDYVYCPHCGQLAEREE